MEIHFHGYKIKYELLDSYFKIIKQGNQINSINFFINLDDFFHKLHHPLINKEFSVIGQVAPKQLVSNIINLMAHYRHYAKSRLGCSNIGIYGIYTSYLRTFKNEMFLPDFRKKFKHNNSPINLDYYHINNTLKLSYDVMNGIVQYIPGIYLIDSEYIEPSVIPYYISLIRNTDWNVYITRDIYDLQYATKLKWTVISPKGENSTIVSGSNIWDYIRNKENAKCENSKPYSSYFYPYLLAIVGDSYRSIPRLRKIGWKTLFKFLDRVIDEWKNTDDITIINKLIDLLQDKKSIKDDDFYANLYSIDIEKQQQQMIDIDKLVIDTQLIDRYDTQALNNANNRIFLHFPLRLEFLLE